MSFFYIFKIIYRTIYRLEEVNDFARSVDVFVTANGILKVLKDY